MDTLVLPRQRDLASPVHSKPLIELILAVFLASSKWAPVSARVNRRGETNDGHVHELILVIVKMLEMYLIGA